MNPSQLLLIIFLQTEFYNVYDM